MSHGSEDIRRKHWCRTHRCAHHPAFVTAPSRPSRWVVGTRHAWRRASQPNTRARGFSFVCVGGRGPVTLVVKVARTLIRGLTMHALDTFVDQAWVDHADQPAVVAARLTQGLSLVENDDHVMRLAMLAHHVLGEHLGRWQEGLAFLTAIAERGVHVADGEATLARCEASLRLCVDVSHVLTTMNESDQCRATVMAACNLAAVDTARATTLLEDAVVRGSALPDGDPGVRSLAAFGNSIAGTLQEMAHLSSAQRDVMIRAAQIARTQWARAGTWREVERAEYRLAVCWLAAGDPKRALQHAKACDSIVQQNGCEPLEVFFAAEALALPARVLGDEQGYARAVTTAQAAFDALPSDEQAWCRTTLERLAAS